MKKVVLGMLAIATLTFTSCSSDDDNVTDNGNENFEVDANNFHGQITSGNNITLDAGTEYFLTGMLEIQNGATLNIPAGTTITATDKINDEEVRYIIVAQGGKININGTASEPVVMTAETKESASWGGLVICGKAKTNKGGSDGASATSEVGDLIYGGSDNNDSSGSITYLRVEYSGYKYSDTKEFNGISLFAVGAGTTFENVSSYKGSDDGIEIFGGAVEANNLVSIDSEDDGIDFADGWTGSGTNWYVRNAIKSGIEASNNGDNGAADYPMTNATLNNLTIIGMGEKPYYFKEGAGMQEITNIVIGGLDSESTHAYFFNDTDDSDAVARIDGGDITVSQVNFLETLNDEQKATDTNLMLTEDNTAVGAGGDATTLPDWASSWAMPTE